MTSILESKYVAPKRPYSQNELKMKREGYWVSVHPLFISGNKGLYPVFKTGGPTGRFPKNHQEFILKSFPTKIHLKVWKCRKHCKIRIRKHFLKEYIN